MATILWLQSSPPPFCNTAHRLDFRIGRQRRTGLRSGRHLSVRLPRAYPTSRGLVSRLIPELPFTADFGERPRWVSRDVGRGVFVSHVGCPPPFRLALP